MPRILVELEARLTPHARLSDEIITDVIEAVVDNLDSLATEPSVGTTRVGDAVDFMVAVTSRLTTRWRPCEWRHR